MYICICVFSHLLGGFLHILTCTCNYMLWHLAPRGNTTRLFLTWYQSHRLAPLLAAAAAARPGLLPPRSTAVAVSLRFPGLLLALDPHPYYWPSIRLCCWIPCSIRLCPASICPASIRPSGSSRASLRRGLSSPRLRSAPDRSVAPVASSPAPRRQLAISPSPELARAPAPRLRVLAAHPPRPSPDFGRPGGNWSPTARIGRPLLLGGP
jgi:hypothetical protein